MIRPLLGLTALLIAIIDGGKMAQAQPVVFNVLKPASLKSVFRSKFNIPTHPEQPITYET